MILSDLFMMLVDKYVIKIPLVNADFRVTNLDKPFSSISMICRI